MDGILKDEPRISQPFLLKWRVKIGPLTETGEGLLSDGVWKQRALIDEFTVFMGSYTVTFKPKDGLVFTDGTISISHLPGMFEWERDMFREISTDSNSRSAQCKKYRGVIINKYGRFGYEFNENGTCFRVP